MKKKDLISINVNELKDFLGHIIANNRYLQEHGKSPVSVEVIGESGIGKSSAIILFVHRNTHGITCRQS